MMKKMPAPNLASQHQSQLNHIPKLKRKQSDKLECYECLLNNFIKSSPDITDHDLAQACIYFAKACGLPLRSAMGGRHHVD